MIPRFMHVYSPPVYRQIYNNISAGSHFATILVSWNCRDFRTR